MPLFIIWTPIGNYWGRFPIPHPLFISPIITVGVSWQKSISGMEPYTFESPICFETCRRKYTGTSPSYLSRNSKNAPAPKAAMRSFCSMPDLISSCKSERREEPSREIRSASMEQKGVITTWNRFLSGSTGSISRMLSPSRFYPGRRGITLTGLDMQKCMRIVSISVAHWIMTESLNMSLILSCIMNCFIWCMIAKSREVEMFIIRLSFVKRSGSFLSTKRQAVGSAGI